MLNMLYLIKLGYLNGNAIKIDVSVWYHCLPLLWFPKRLAFCFFVAGLCNHMASFVTLCFMMDIIYISKGVAPPPYDFWSNWRDALLVHGCSVASTWRFQYLFAAVILAGLYYQILWRPLIFKPGANFIR